MTNEDAPVGMEQQDFMMAIYILLQRNNDLLTIIAQAANPEATAQMRTAHAQGVVFSSPPSLAPDEDATSE